MPEQTIRVLVAAALPRALWITEVDLDVGGEHREGGHVVFMEIDRDSLDALISHIDAEGWMDSL